MLLIFSKRLVTISLIHLKTVIMIKIISGVGLGNSVDQFLCMKIKEERSKLDSFSVFVGFST